MSPEIEFLTARYDEDEAVARAASSNEQWWVDGPTELTGKWWVYDTGAKFDRHEIASHVARFDPARVLADIAAKRAILEMHGQAVAIDTVIDHLIQPYVEHPDFDPAWRV